MRLINTITGEKVDGVIEMVTANEIKGISKSKRFDFDWNVEKDLDVYKIRLRDSDEILGLMSLIDWPEELRIEIHLLESSKENVGSKSKLYGNIAGCLIAFACGTSFERGYAGFISLVPKTNLRKYYINEYHMEEGGRSVFSDTENSMALIEKYL